MKSDRRKKQRKKAQMGQKEGKKRITFQRHHIQPRNYYFKGVIAFLEIKGLCPRTAIKLTGLLQCRQQIAFVTELKGHHYHVKTSHFSALKDFTGVVTVTRLGGKHIFHALSVFVQLLGARLTGSPRLSGQSPTANPTSSETFVTQEKKFRWLQYLKLF